MHRCCSSQGNMGGSCSCGLFPGQTNPFSMFFSMPNHKSFDEANMYHYASSPSSVDCTLSLGTPSTRMTEKEEKRRSGSRVSNFSWDLLHHGNGPPQQKSSRGGNSGGSAGVNNGCGLGRRCANCDTTSTPLWRNGPRGPKSLCNACGIRFKKEERRASSAAGNGASSGVVVMEGGWAHHQSQTQKPSPCFSPSINNDYTLTEDESGGGDGDNSISFLPWRSDSKIGFSVCRVTNIQHI